MGISQDLFRNQGGSPSPRSSSKGISSDLFAPRTQPTQQQIQLTASQKAANEEEERKKKKKGFLSKAVDFVDDIFSKEKPPLKTPTKLPDTFNVQKKIDLGPKEAGPSGQLTQEVKQSQTFRGLQDTTARVGKQVIEAPLKTEATRSFYAGIGDIQATAGATATWLGADGIGKRLADEGAIKQKFAPPAPTDPLSWKMLYDPRFYTTHVARSLPFSLALIPAALIGGTAGAAGGTALGLGLLGRTILGAIGGAALSRPIESALEAGSTYDEMIKKGKSPEEADKAANKTFLSNLALTGMDAAQFAIAFAPSPFRGGNRILKGIQRTAGIGGSMAMEGAEEVLQTAIQSDAQGEKIDPFSEESKLSFALGSTMGGGLGVAGTIYTEIQERTKQAYPDEFQAAYQANIDKGMDTDLATNQALETVVSAHSKEVTRLVEDTIEQLTTPLELVEEDGQVVAPQVAALDDTALIEQAKAYDIDIPDTFRSDAEKQAYQQLLSDPDGMVQKYFDTFRKEGEALHINGDNAKTLYDNYQEINDVEYDRTGGNLAKLVYRRALVEFKDDPRPVLVSAGGPGSGKSTTLQERLEDYSIYFDSNLADPKRATERIDEALASGKEVNIMYVYRDAEAAFTDGVLKRFDEGNARIVRIEGHANNHATIPEVILKLDEHYKGNDKVDIAVFDNNHGAGNAQEVDLAFVKDIKYNKTDLTSKLYGRAKQELESGRITEDQFAALTEGVATKDASTLQSSSEEQGSQKQQESSVVYYHGTKSKNIDSIEQDGFKGDVVSISAEREVSERFTGSDGAGKVFEVNLAEDANLATAEQLIALRDSIYSGQTRRGKELATGEAMSRLQEQGFDGVDFRGSNTIEGINEKEIRLWNKEKLTIRKDSESATVTKAPKAAPESAPIGTGKEKTSKAFQRFKDQILVEDLERYDFDEKTGKYNTLNLEKDAEAAAALIEKDPKQALRIAFGVEPPPAGQTDTAISIALANKMGDEGNLKLQTMLEVSRALRQTRRGQEIVSERGRFNQDSAQAHVRELLARRLENIGNNFSDEALKVVGKKGSAKERAVKKIDKRTDVLKQRLTKEQTKIRVAQEILDALTCK